MAEQPGGGTGAVLKPSLPHNPKPAGRELEDRARLDEAARASLDTVHTMATDWRTGMAGLITLVTATLLFQGKGSINDYSRGVQVTLGVLVVASLAASVASLLLFLTAAHGRPGPVPAQVILDQGLDVYNLGLALVALRDLRRARRWGVASAVLLAAGIVLSWYGETQVTTAVAPVSVTVRPGSVAAGLPLCGELKGLDGTTTVLQIDGEPGARSIPTADIIGLRVVAGC